MKKPRFKQRLQEIVNLLKNLNISEININQLSLEISILTSISRHDTDLLDEFREIIDKRPELSRLLYIVLSQSGERELKLIPSQHKRFPNLAGLVRELRLSCQGDIKGEICHRLALSSEEKVVKEGDYYPNYLAFYSTCLDFLKNEIFIPGVIAEIIIEYVKAPAFPAYHKQKIENQINKDTLEKIKIQLSNNPKSRKEFFLSLDSSKQQELKYAFHLEEEAWNDYLMSQQWILINLLSKPTTSKQFRFFQPLPCLELPIPVQQQLEGNKPKKKPE